MLIIIVKKKLRPRLAEYGARGTRARDGGGGADEHEPRDGGPRTGDGGPLPRGVVVHAQPVPPVPARVAAVGGGTAGPDPDRLGPEVTHPRGLPRSEPTVVRRRAYLGRIQRDVQQGGMLFDDHEVHLFGDVSVAVDLEQFAAGACLKRGSSGAVRDKKNHRPRKYNSERADHDTQ